ncbi:hypothetical protein LCGC14_1348230 [marine sediment metagenome]|uniref:Uncharacterized protein n=1 Tax=marine sediment metagenome TaxID=412755 RepID=A0A0F9KBP5_9ZZZZ
MKVKWRHRQTVGKIKIKNKDIIRMLKLGAIFELSPAYRTYYKGGIEYKKKLLHVSLRLKNNDGYILR